MSRLAGFALVAGILAGCSSSSGTDTGPSVASEVFSAGKQLVAARRDGVPQAVTPSREVIAGLREPVLQINPELAGGSDFLRLAVSRNDSGVGTVEVWNSSVMAHVFLRNGVLVGTRGVGGDIISADANETIRALQSRTDRSSTRRYTISDGDVTTTDYQFRCVLRNQGSENITVAYQVFETTRMRESCVGVPRQDQRITNDYWVERATGVVRQSRQWVGPRIGYFNFKLLKN